MLIDFLKSTWIIVLILLVAVGFIATLWVGAGLFRGRK